VYTHTWEYVPRSLVGLSWTAVESPAPGESLVFAPSVYSSAAALNRQTGLRGVPRRWSQHIVINASEKAFTTPNRSAFFSSVSRWQSARRRHSTAFRKKRRYVGKSLRDLQH